VSLDQSEITIPFVLFEVQGLKKLPTQRLQKQQLHVACTHSYCCWCCWSWLGCNVVGPSAWWQRQHKMRCSRA